MIKIAYSSRAIKFLKKSPQNLRPRIILKIKLLSENPLRSDLNIKKLSGTKRSYRLRIGNIRVIYELKMEEKIVYIHEIGFRGSVY